MSNASSSGFIPLAQAVEMTTRYRQNKDKIIDQTFAGRDILALSDRFDRKVFDKLLGKANCTYIRLYYGMDENLQVRPIVVAVDENDRDMIPDSAKLEADGGDGGEGGGDVGDDTLRCPPVCPPPSPLNEG